MTTALARLYLAAEAMIDYIMGAPHYCKCGDCPDCEALAELILAVELMNIELTGGSAKPRTRPQLKLVK